MTYSPTLQPNVAPNGIRYGIISANSLDQDLFQSLWDSGKDLSWEAAKAEIQADLEREAESIEDEVRIALAEIGGWTEREYEDAWDHRVEAAYNRLGFSDREDFVDTQLEKALEQLQIEEPNITFKMDGVVGQIGWLGGAPLVWIFESPYTGTFQLCSPCVPNACNLDQPENGGYAGYTVPTHWLA